MTSEGAPSDAVATSSRAIESPKKRRRRDDLGLAAVVLLGLVILDTLGFSSGASWIWIGLTFVTWLAFAIRAFGRWRSCRGGVWAIALASPLCLLGPIVAVALFNGEVRASVVRDYRDAYAVRRTDPRAWRLIGGLIASIALGLAVIIGIFILLAIAGGDYNGYVYPHTEQVVAWVGAVAAMVAVVVITARWLTRGSLQVRRLGLAGPLATAALVFIGIAGSWLAGHAGPDPRPTNAVPPTVTGTSRVGERLLAHEGLWHWPKDVPRTVPSRFSYRWKRSSHRCLAASGLRAQAARAT